MSDAKAGAGFSDIPQDEMKLFWEVYSAHHDQVSEKVRELLAGLSEFAPFMNMISEEQRKAQSEASFAKLEEAVETGDWGPYIAHLEEQGATYARIGLGFPAWFKAVGATRRILAPILVTRFGKDLGKLSAAMMGMDEFFDSALAVIGNAYLLGKESTILHQQEAIRELSTPVLPVRAGLLVLPVIGVIDSDRAIRLTQNLLEGIRTARAQVAVIDITGVPSVDSKVANHLIQTVEAAQLMGARVILTGLSPAIARALVALGVDLTKLNTVGDLQGGLAEAERHLRRSGEDPT